MAETPRPPESQGPDTWPVADRSGDWRSNLVFIADVCQKLAIPLLTVAATGLGIYLSYSANERARLSREREQEIAAENNRLSLQNQREEAETGIRSAMFGELVGPLLSGKEEKEKNATSQQQAERLALHAEMLTLNFHHHFELGPALRYVDGLNSQSDEARNRLRSAARRVISRQLAPLMKTSGTAGEAGRYVEIKLSEYHDRRLAPDQRSDSKMRPNLASCYQLPPPEPEQFVDPCKRSADDPGVIEMICSTERPMRELSIGEGATATKVMIQAETQPLIVRSPDCQDTLKVTFSSFDWDDATVSVSAETLPPGDLRAEEMAECPKKPDEKVSVAPPAPRAGKLPKQNVEFTLTPYSLPYSDNTMLPSGNRFGVYVKTAAEISCKPDDPGSKIERQAIVWFVWFPQDFVPPMERPDEMNRKMPGSATDGDEDGNAEANGGSSAAGASGT